VRQPQTRSWAAARSETLAKVEKVRLRETRVRRQVLRPTNTRRATARASLLKGAEKKGGKKRRGEGGRRTCSTTLRHYSATPLRQGHRRGPVRRARVISQKKIYTPRPPFDRSPPSSSPDSRGQIWPARVHHNCNSARKGQKPKLQHLRIRVQLPATIF